ncbi:MAG TPA: FtsL-like putative cell division protein [Bacteroidota bacterium]|nr:FtsL-like putative cell division protein [Bacteroidota bacterium]
MAKLFNNEAEFLAQKALEDTPPQTERPPLSTFQESTRPMIYSGTLPLPNARTTVDPGRADVYTPRNRKIVRRKVSPFNAVLLLFATAIAIVIYISNIIAVDQLMNEINALQNQHQQILMEQEILKARINRLSSLERIRQMAEGELQLRNPKHPPEILPVDHEKIREIEQTLKQSQQE